MLTDVATLGLVAGVAALSTAGLAMTLVQPETETAADESPIDLRDDSTGLWGPAAFDLTVTTRIAAGRRHLRPISVAVFDVVDPDDAIEDVMGDVVRSTLRDADLAFRLSSQRFALVLEDTPETGAVWAVERVRRALGDCAPTALLWAGIACYPAHGTEPRSVRRCAETALSHAREWPQARIEVAVAE